jgi:ATP-dependent Clp protease ATP-binding subunit ClpB
VAQRAKTYHEGSLTPLSLLAALAELRNDDTHDVLREFNVTTGDLRQAMTIAGPGGTDRPHSPAKESSSQPPASKSRPSQTGTHDGKGDDNSDSEETFLARYGHDLTEEAARGRLAPIVGRATEVRRLMQILSRRRKNNPLLVGEPGVGKRAVVQALAQRMAASDLPPSLKGRRLVALELGNLLAGARLRGHLEERIRALLDELRHDGGGAILFAEEITPLLGTAGATAGLVANLLKPALAAGHLRLIGRATPMEYRQHVSADPTWSACFQPINVAAPSAEETATILRGVVTQYEIHHAVRISDPACLAAISYGQRYLPDRSLPEKAIDLIDEAAARLRLEIDSRPAPLDALERQLEALHIERDSLQDDHDEASRGHLKEIEQRIEQLVPQAAAMHRQWEAERALLEELRKAKGKIEETRQEEIRARTDGDLQRAAELRHHQLPRLEAQAGQVEARVAQQLEPLLREAVTEEDIATIISDWTGVPVAKMLQDESQRLLAMDETLARRVVGQKEAVLSVARAIRRARVGLRDPGRPIGSFLFLGPSGVGKTELAKALAEFLFDEENAITRIDMSEFMERHMVARLVGAPPGYVDSDEGGYLTEAVRARPYSVVLLDEIEKAHPDVFDLLLQVLDDGRLTDGRGRTVDFTHAVIIMTSNLAGHGILAHQGGHESLRALVDEELRKHLRPEFLNRIDDIVIFERLDRPALTQIVRLQTKQLARLLHHRGLALELTKAAEALIVEMGYEPAFGARPVRRVLLKQVQDPLAEYLLQQPDTTGQRVVVDASEGGFVFRREQRDKKSPQEVKNG